MLLKCTDRAMDFLLAAKKVKNNVETLKSVKAMKGELLLEGGVPRIDPELTLKQHLEFIEQAAPGLLRTYKDRLCCLSYDFIKQKKDPSQKIYTQGGGSYNPPPTAPAAAPLPASRAPKARAAAKHVDNIRNLFN